MSMGGSGDLLRGVTVPQYAFAGGQATLSCSYDLRNRRLYSLKWYHNGTEFYRYVPTERQGPTTSKTPHKFAVNELFRDDQRVTLSLTRLAVAASGQYRCEVIAEHPSFRTEWFGANMTVLREPLSAPVLVGARDVYEPSEIIKIGCQPSNRPALDHHTQPTLQWFLQGNQVASDLVTPYGSALQRGVSGLSLRVPGEQVVSAGGQMVAECRLTLGPHRYTSNTTLKVRPVSTTYHDYHASGSRHAESTSRSAHSLRLSLAASLGTAALLVLPLL
ncbi:uncharacterized protein LOC127000110 [Eriocheir sinensis]|uniref:uncharacterized protein LOC127000110 n=1 Tax=Eriocheir sinensis TaxID=95602 RepID=UPI0021C568E7|nr:uncharacterized protein LOC127000110 [Eriocheir sinensis]